MAEAQRNLGMTGIYAPPNTSLAAPVLGMPGQVSAQARTDTPNHSDGYVYDCRMVSVS
jgi:hypothetical protein